MDEFREFIFDLDLMDLPLVGGEYTWSNGRVWSRLDRFLVSTTWEAHYPEVSQKRLARVSSDHFPIILDCGGIHRGSRYFKFENMWLTTDGFVEMVRAWWYSYQFLGTPSYILASKLKALKQDLKKWNLEVFGHTDNQKAKLLEELQELEDKELLGDNSEEMLLRKGSEVFSSSPELENHIVHYYETLLTESFPWRPKLDALNFEAIDLQSVSILERPFVEEEIYKVLSGMAKDKAPGPDGFSIGRAVNEPSTSEPGVCELGSFTTRVELELGSFISRAHYSVRARLV
ncbi:uncharacterized protein LOC118348231 [Juglans regia]|uniref:Uncharacterized protein LOC118348231 n=1 Tax=Juglans regia TaxID=51240 RepID=A0A6P9ECV9_JUGRE|nr:uncharacterized protein LOC118348231 [Juglans regia]